MAAYATGILTKVPDQLFIGGQWVAAESGDTIVVNDPATGAVLAEIADGTVDDGIRALDAAVDAGESWARTSARVRSEILRSAFDLLQRRRDEFALLMTLEMGKPIAESRSEVTYGGEFLRWFSEEAVRIHGRFGPTPEGNGRMIVTRRPVGPSYLITPWNFPLAMATRKLAPAIAAGCTAVIKPATLTPLTTLALVALLDEAGLPEGVVNVITTTSSSALSRALMADPRLRKISFTGSTQVGVSLLKLAADNVLNTSMELGGNAPFIVFDDADLDLAVDAAILAKFRNTGQACTAANRFLVQDGVADAFVARLTARVAEMKIGPGVDTEVTIGPLIDHNAVANSARLVRDAVDKGARLVHGGSAGEGPGAFFEPTLIDHITDDMAVSTEEIFAPIVGIRRFATEAQAVRLANDCPVGLAGYVYTESLARGQRMIDLLDTGLMGLNVGVISNAAAPFGGVKQSGLGREGGAEGIEEYLETKYTLMPEPHRE
ncbi:NAD-dependent succinate-semialdehyde dehydrogenase [Mycolicibacterium stellerae]|uniref:NAD-dependent succinate-semialdehyde dehydrogenase n=1 Tax=Mycolicibacterium stellerae TaxID=2358193 RepID=UPI000F0B5F0D|nr:NAD-dependent succinate-semialdehyde dehydrogenase [Mycolicibacterium stellerae]